METPRVCTNLSENRRQFLQSNVGQCCCRGPGGSKDIYLFI